MRAELEVGQKFLFCISLKHYNELIQKDQSMYIYIMDCIQGDVMSNGI